MKKAIRWSSGLILSIAMAAPMVSAQQHGHQRMMMPRVPADKLEEARALRSPLPPSPDIVEQGKAIYEGKGTCINCHGVNGRGDGPGAASLNPPPRVFRSHGFWRHRSEGEIFWVIKHGSPGTGMIPFGGMLTDEEIWTVIQYEQSFAGGPHGGRGPRHGRGGRHGGRGMMHHQEPGGEIRGYSETVSGYQQKSSVSEVKEKVEKAKGASISITQALATANEKVAGTVLEVEFEIENGRNFWEVEVGTSDGKMMEIKIDSQNGEVLSSEEKNLEEPQKQMGRHKGMQHHGSDKEHECCGKDMIEPN